MKVFHLINTLSAGGAELHLLTLCRQSKRRGIDASVGFLREQVKGSRSLRRDFEMANIRVFDLRASSRYDWSFLGRLAKLLKQERPDVLHTHLPRADIAGELVSHWIRPAAFLCSVHGIYSDRWFGRWAAPFMRRAYRQSDAVIAISSAVQDWLRQAAGVSGNKIRVIHYGIDLDSFSHAALGAPQGRRQRQPFTIGSIGRLEAGKGFDCLIGAMKNLTQQVPQANLWIAGHDPLGYGKTLESLIARLKLQKHVKLVGFQSDIAGFLNRTDVFAFASKSEGFGQVVIEAMAAGKPVIASRLPPLTEIVLQGETGLLVEADNPKAFADGLNWLFARPEDRRRFGEIGRQRVRRHFSAEKMVDETLRLYDETIRQSSFQRTLPI